MQSIPAMMAIFAVTNRLVALAIAKPIPNWKADGIAIPLTRHTFLNSNKSIDLRDVISSHGISLEARILRSLDNYEMNTGTVHPFAPAKQSESGLGTRGASVPLIPYYNTLWSAEISVGNPPKTLKVHIDTGSADMWVLQTGCSGVSADRDLWDPNSSESAQKMQPFELDYADGTIVRGNLYTDTVTIGGFTANPQTFVSVTSYTSHWQLPEKGNAEGLLGLAFPSVSRFRAYPLLASLVGQGKLINPTFSLKLTPSGAEMYIGGANNMLYKGDITYTPITNPGLWQASIDNVCINGDPILVNVPAMFDTGANFIYGDWNQVSELYTRIGGKVREHNGYGLYYLPCDSFPTMSFTFGGRTFEISPQLLRLNQLDKDSSDCFSAVVGRRASYGFWSMGITFLQGVYSVFDYTSLQIGFAELA